MTLKQKFYSIRKSELKEPVQNAMNKILEKTKNFTIKDEKTNNAIEASLDKLIATLKETNPNALKEKGQKVSVMSYAKDIRDKGESFEDAKKRASEEIKNEKEEGEKLVKTEMQKLMSFMKTYKELDGISGKDTDLGRDSVRVAKPRGRRISKDGNIYYENRENRIDRLAPNYPKNAPLLEDGGGVGVKRYNIMSNVGKSKYVVNFYDGKKQHKDSSEFFDIKIFKNKKDLNNFENKLIEEGYKYGSSSSFEYGGGVKDLTLHRLNSASNSKTTYLSSLDGKKIYIWENGILYDTTEDLKKSTSYRMNRLSLNILPFDYKKHLELELGGGVDGFNLAGQLDGNFNVGQNDGDLSGTTGTFYSGLVGETGAMSAGEMFARGGSLEGHGIKTGDTFMKTISGNIQKVKDKDGNIMYIDLSTGERDSQPPLHFEDGGSVYAEKGVRLKSALMRDRNNVNASEDYEVRYSKDKSHRSGYTQPKMVRTKLEEEEYSFFKKGGLLTPKERYILEIKGLSGVRKEAIENYVSKNNLSDSEVLNIVIGLGRKQIEGTDVAIAISGKENNNFSKKLIAFAKSDKAVKMNDGGEFMTDPNFGNFQNQVYSNGGSLEEKRKEYLEKIGNNEADIRDKIGANSGGEIRNNKKLLKEYAELVEKMVKKEGVAKGSLDQEDYDYYTDENWHLLNEFLVWNGYFEPEITIKEQKWRKEYFSDPKKKNYVSDPSIITVTIVTGKTTSKEYILHADIKSVTFKDGIFEKKVSGSEVYNGANILSKGDILKDDAIYVAKRNIVSVELKDGSEVKPANGYWIKKKATATVQNNEQKADQSKNSHSGTDLSKVVASSNKFKIGDFVYNKRTKTIGRVRDVFDKGDLRTDADGVVSVSELTLYKEGNPTHRKAQIAPSTLKELESTVFKGGGSVAKKETLFELAKRIRKDGEVWNEALKRAGTMRRNK